MIRTTSCDETIEDTTMIFNIMIPMNNDNNDIDEEASYSYTIWKGSLLVEAIFSYANP